MKKYITNTDAKERAKFMMEYFKNDATLEEVARCYSITRQRVQQIFTKFYPKEYKDLLHERKEERKLETRLRKEQRTVICNQCNKKFHPAAQEKLCSRECRLKKMGAMIFHKYPAWAQGRGICKKNFSKVEWRELQRIRSNDYYQRHKEKLSAQRKKWMAENPERQKLFQTRCAERKLYGHAITPLPRAINTYAVKP